MIFLYFICTTLSTVGFGDYRPISDYERLEIIPYLLFGYLVFSYLISEMRANNAKIFYTMRTFEDLSGLNMFI